MKKNQKQMMSNFSEGINYPWNKPKRLWNILWVLIPIFGWFAIAGYGKKIVYTLVKVQRKKIPPFGDFWDNFVTGIKITVYMIPTWILIFFIMSFPLIGKLLYFFVMVFMVPWLTINFYIKDDFYALWELEKCFNIITSNAKEYIILYFYTLGYSIIYGLLSILLVGIPANAFGGMYYLTDFYKRHN